MSRTWVAWPRSHGLLAQPRCASTPRSRGLGRAGAWPGLRNPGRAISFSPSLIWLFLSLLSGLPHSDLIRSGKVRLCLRLGRFLKFFWIINRVFKTRFSSSPHVENNATSDVIRLWKSSSKDSIYGSKSSLLDLNC